jgi:hypothetical protein
MIAAGAPIVVSWVWKVNVILLVTALLPGIWISIPVHKITRGHVIEDGKILMTLILLPLLTMLYSPAQSFILLNTTFKSAEFIGQIVCIYELFHIMEVESFCYIYTI